MESRFRIARVILALALTAVCLSALAWAGRSYHNYRKQTSLREALAAGNAALEAKDYPRACLELGRYLIVNYHDISALLKYADAQIHIRPRTKDTTQAAMNALERALLIQRGHPQASQMLCEWYLTADMPSAAERIARAWLAAHPDTDRPGCALASALIAQNKTQEAAALLEQLLKTDPRCVQAAATLAMLRAKGGSRDDLQQAGELLEEAVKARPEDPAGHIALGRFYLHTGDEARLTSELSAAHAMAQNVEDILELGLLLTEVGSFARARVQFERAEQLAPENPKVYLAFGQACLAIEAYATGAELADRALAAPLGGERVDILPMSTELYVAAGCTPKARNCITELRAADAPTAVLTYLEGTASVAEGKLYEGIAQLQSATRIASQYARPHLALGRAFTRAGDLRRAASELREYLRLSGESNVPVQLELAELYARLGRWTDAAAISGSVEKANPGNPAAIWANLELQALIARPEGPQPNPQSIAELHDRAAALAERQPGDARLQILLARLKGWSGHHDEAVRLLERLRESSDSRFIATMSLVDFWADRGRWDKAVTECRNALALADSAHAAAVRQRLAELLMAKGDLSAAAELAEDRGGQLPPAQRCAIRVNLAKALLRDHQTRAACEILIRAAADDPQDTASRLLLLAMPDAPQEERQELVDELVKIQGDAGLDWRVWQAHVWLDRSDWTGRRGQIEALLQEVIRRDPARDDALAATGRMAELGGETNKAIEMYRRALEANRDYRAIGQRYLALAAEANKWADVDHALELLPADEASQPYRVAQALRKGESDRAVTMLEKRISSQPSDYASRLQLAALKRVAGQSEEANRLIEEAAVAAPDALEVLVARLEQCLARGEHNRGIELCNAALAKSPTPQVMMLRAVVEEAGGDAAAAERDLQSAAASQDWTERALVALGQLHQRRNHYDAALAVWREGLKAVPGSIALRQAMVGLMLMMTGPPHQQGEAMLQELHAERPDDEAVLMMHADHLARSKPDAAARLYEQIIEKHPGAIEACYRLAGMANKRGQRQRALEIIEQGLRSDPRDLDLLLLKAELLANSDSHLALVTAKQAASVAQARVNAYPGDESAAITLSRVIAIYQSASEAISTLQAFLARKEAASAWNARLALAELYIASGHLKEAAPLIAEARRIAPEHPNPLRAQVVLLAAQRDWDGIVELAAQSSQVTDDIGVGLMAAYALTSGRDPRYTPSAVQILERLVAQNPDDLAVIYRLGMTYLNAGQVSAAKASLQKALAAQPDNVEIRNNLAWLLCELESNPQEAEALTTDALNSCRSDPLYPNLLDTAGVVQYRLAVAEQSQKRLENSKLYLEECLRDPRTTRATQVAATWHLARTLAEIAPDRSKDLLMRLRDPQTAQLLSADNRLEAERLLARLSGRITAGSATP